MSKTEIKEAIVDNLIANRKQLVIELAALCAWEHGFQDKAAIINNQIDSIDKQLVKYAS